MRRIIILLVFLGCGIAARSQTLNPFPNTDSLRRFINKWVRNSPIESFTNLRLNSALLGITRFIDSADSGLHPSDTAAMLSSYVRLQRFLDSCSALRAAIASGGIDTTSLSNRINAKASQAALVDSAAAIRADMGTGTAGITTTPNVDSLVVGADTVADRDNPLNNALYRGNNAPSFKSALAIAKRGLGRRGIIFHGDSQTEIDSLYDYANKMYWRDKIPIAGPGFISVKVAPIGWSSNSISAGWTLKDKTSGGRGLDMYSLVSTVSSSDITFLPNTFTGETYYDFTTVEVWWYGVSGGGRFTIQCEGNTKSIDTDSALGLQRTVITGLTDTRHSVTIHLVSQGTNGCEILGFNLYRNVPGLVIHKIAQTGASAGDYLALDSALYVNQLKFLGATGMHLFLGTNERLGDAPPPDFKANMKALLRRVKAVDTLMSVVLSGQVEKDEVIHFTGGNYPVEQYNDQLRQIALEDSVAFFDLFKIFGIYGRANARGLYRDGLHLSPLGAFLAVSALWGAFDVPATMNPKSFEWDDPHLRVKRTIYSDFGDSVNFNGLGVMSWKFAGANGRASLKSTGGITTLSTTDGNVELGSGATIGYFLGITSGVSFNIGTKSFGGSNLRNITVNNDVTNNPALGVISATVTANSGTLWGIDMFAPNIPNASSLILYRYGKNTSTNNFGAIAYNHVGNGSADNSLSIGASGGGHYLFNDGTTQWSGQTFNANIRKRGAYFHRSIGFNKDSLSTRSSTASLFLMAIDTASGADSNRLVKLPFSALPSTTTLYSGDGTATNRTITVSGYLNMLGGEVKIGSSTDNGSFTLQNDGGFWNNGVVNLQGTKSSTSLAYLMGKDNDSALSRVVVQSSDNSITITPGTGALDFKVSGTNSFPILTYTPSATGVTNITALSTSTIRYQRIGMRVDVWGTIGIQPTAASAATEVAFPLPVASSFTGGELSGSGYSETVPQGIAFKADISNSRGSIVFYATNNTMNNYYFHFSYEVTPP